MIETTYIFDGRDEEGHDPALHIGEMISLIGLPSPDLLSKSIHSWRVFDESGT